MESNGRLPSSPVATLPDELLSNIMERLPAGARVRFRAVCRQWNSLPPARRPPLPWLLTHVPPKEEGNNRSVRDLVMSFYCPWEQRRYEIPGLVGSECCRKVVGSSPDGAWLLYVDSAGVINGVHVPSGKRVQAPSTRDWNFNNNCSRAIIFFPSSTFSSAGVGTSADGYTIVALFDDLDLGVQELAFTRDGEEEKGISWTNIFSHPTAIRSLRHMLLCAGSLYVATDEGQALRVDGLVGGSGATTSWTPLPSWSPLVPPERAGPSTPTASGRMQNVTPTTYLACFDSGIWQIWGSPSRAVYTSNTMGVGFARLDLSRGEWDHTTAEIGEYAAFLGNGHPLVYSTREFPELASGRIRLDCVPEFTPPLMFGKPDELAWGDKDRPQPTWVVPDVC